MQRRLSLAMLLLVACSGAEEGARPPAAEPPPLAVTVLAVQAESLPASLEVVAQVEGARETEVRARVGGILEKQLYEEGEAVKAGQPLFRIDRSSYEIALADAEARAAQAAREKQRIEKLMAAEAVSERAHDDAVFAHDVAQAALRRARLDLSWTTVTAPVAGTTGRALRSEGSLISPDDQDVLTKIHQLDPIWVRFSLSEGEIAKLPGAAIEAGSVSRVELLLPDGSVYAKPGRINFLASTIDLTLGTRQLRAEFDNPDARLLPGMFVRVRLVTHAKRDVFRVPQDAVLRSQTGALLMLAGAGNRVEPRPVRLGEWRGRDWVVLEGLAPGDRVIVDHLMHLRPGLVVEPRAVQVETGAPSGPAPGAKS